MEENQNKGPKCESEPTPEVKEPTKLQLFFTFVIFAVCIFMIVKCVSSGIDSHKGPNDRIEEASLQIAKSMVEQQLNYPATADFSWLSIKREKFGDSTYRIKGTLTAKNAFGVEQELRYTVTMTYFEGDPFDISSWNITTCNVRENR